MSKKVSGKLQYLETACTQGEAKRGQFWVNKFLPIQQNLTLWGDNFFSDTAAVVNPVTGLCVLTIIHITVERLKYYSKKVHAA